MVQSLPLEASSASTILGFISFVVTLITLLRVTWSELSNLVAAPTQIHFTLSNLKEALWEEKAACRRISRQLRKLSHQRRRSGSSARAAKGYSEKGDIPSYALGGADFKILQETTKALCQKFADIERPYLKANLVSSPTGADNWDDVETATRYEETGFSNDYSSMTLGMRLHWLKDKGDVESMWASLGRLQQRRTAREVTDLLSEVQSMPSHMRELKLISNPTDSMESDRDNEARVHVRRKRKSR